MAAIRNIRSHFFLQLELLTGIADRFSAGYATTMPASISCPYEMMDASDLPVFGEKKTEVMTFPVNYFFVKNMQEIQ